MVGEKDWMCLVALLSQLHLIDMFVVLKFLSESAQKRGLKFYLRQCKFICRNDVCDDKDICENVDLCNLGHYHQESLNDW